MSITDHVLNRRAFLAWTGGAAAAVAVGALTGCTPGAASPGPSGSGLVFPSTPATGDLQMVWSYSDQTADIQKLFEGFQNANPKANLKMLWNADEAKLIASGAPVDLVHTGDSQLQTLELSANIDGNDVSDFYPYTIEPLRVDGVLRALPMFFQISLLYFNKSIFDQAGMDYPTADWNYDDLVAAAKELTVANGSSPTQWGLEVEQGWWGSWLIAVRQAGGDVFDGEGKVVLDSADAVAGMEWFNSLMQPGASKVTPKPTEDNLGGFKGGRTAMSFGSHTGNWGVFRGSDIDFDVQIIPEGLKQRRGAEYALDAEGVLQRSKNPSGAGALLDYMTSEESGKTYWSKLYGPSPRKSVADALLKVKASDRPAPQNLEAVYTSIDDELGVPAPRNPAYVDVLLKYIQPQVDLMIEGKQSPADAMKTATKNANAYLETL